MDITRDSRIADVAAAQPGTIRVFQRHGIDFCCGGKRPLGDACAEHGLSFEGLRDDLVAAVAAGPATPSFDWSGAPLDAVVARIVERYHVWLREELPRLEQMADKVRTVHGDRHPEVVEVASTLKSVVCDLGPHMMKEERVLFPYVARLAELTRDGMPLAGSPFGTVENPIRTMEAEHEAVGELLVTMRRLTSGYTPPEDACNTYRGLYHGLAELQRELHEHIHVENNVLFPRATALEQQLLAGQAVRT